MSGTGARDEGLRREVMECPVCGTVTMPNMLADGSYVCSCTAEAALPAPGPGPRETVPAPVDDPSFATTGTGAPDKAPPGDHGQFGRDVATEDYKPLEPPPGR